jgi:hypothetical protein
MPNSLPHITRARRLPAALAAGLLLAAAGCGGGDGDQAQPTVATAPAPAATSPASEPATGTPRAVVVIFSDPAGQGLVAVRRTVTAGSDLRAALVGLAQGPGAADGAVAALPAGTTVVGTNVAGGEALVNLSQEFLDGYPSGGAAAEFAVLAPIVYTATEVAGVERVRITVDGRPPAPVGSQYDWSRAFTRADVGLVPVEGL